MAVLIAWRPRRGTPVGIAMALLAAGTLSAGAAAADREGSRFVRETFLAPDPTWVDNAGLGSITLVQLPYADPGSALQQLFWNSSIEDVAILPGATRPDAFRVRPARIAADGALLLTEESRNRPLLLQTYGSSVRFANARLLARAPRFELWRPHGQPRLSLLAAGFYEDGWLATSSRITVWPQAGARGPRQLRFTVSAPRQQPGLTLSLSAAGRTQELRLRSGQSRALSFNVDGGKLWTLHLKSSRVIALGDRRVVGVHASTPTLQPFETRDARA
ncbi:MAG: hypothetical protein H0T39_12905 [Actinobacteria bacterium]|nr:hypothetical protein [Actinomycetota bacterium]